MNDKENDILNENVGTPDRKPSVPAGLQTAENKDIIEYLFSNGNRLLTATGGAMELSHDMQSLIAYFAGGEIIVSRTHRYDGRVLAFIDLLKRKSQIVREPFYSDLGLVSGIRSTYRWWCAYFCARI